jgi:hypothetical protein
MANQAQITSVEAIAAFRAKLIVFVSQARPVLEEVSGDVAHTRAWLQDEQRRFWETELRKRSRKLEEAKQELFNATVSQMSAVSALHRMAVQRGQRAVDEADNKLKLLKKWDHDLENRTAPLMKQVDQLHGFLLTDMARAVAYLDQVLKALEAYASVPIPGAATGSTGGGPTEAEAHA